MAASTTILVLLIGMTVTAGAVLILFDWRLTLSGLLLNYIFQALFIAQQQFIIPDIAIGGRFFSSLIFVKLITGVAVVLILAITALTFSRDYGLEDLDEFSLTELRRAARRAQRAHAMKTRSLGDYLLPTWTLLMAVLASYFLPRVYPLASSPGVDFAWYLLMLSGIATLILAQDVLKIGLGLLLCMSGLDLLYTALAGGVGIVALGLLSLVTVLLALVIAYLSGLLYGRLKTLDLSEIQRR
ncbi:MAG: hypothetical protein KatS3mg057_0883 [Herpetosiphonaceae bacterium]|nr:MAG: hypothetical protein KatS3mg057_0883 [Herpetosiphonaceae bacterium]